jgi:ABC-type cobalamin/Fe3+-siderophores transport system ATPase subunit
VTYYRSIRDEQELSFVATELNEGTARDVKIRPAVHLRVLPVIGLYGPNASGKSNVLSALAHLGRLGSGRLFPADDDIRREVLDWEPHVLDPITREQPTRYEVEFVAEDIRYAYGLSFTEDLIHTEWLHAYPHGRRQVWFERDPAAPGKLRVPDNHLGSTQSALASLARTDRPFLSLASEVSHARLEPIARWFNQLTSLGAGRDHFPHYFLVSLFTGEHSERVVDLLRRADRGIEGADVVETESLEAALARGASRPRPEVRLRHRGRKGGSPLPLRFESDGTRAWLWILRLLLPALKDGSVLIVDELDASLHPELAAETIRMFYDPRLNRRGAQLLFTSHDVSMLSTVYGRPLLDRDQVWFTEKNDDGATELFPLGDLKPRKGENLERGYLSGRYGAVPGLSPGELARALWPEED